MLAATVRVDRAVKGQVWRVVAGDDGFSRLDANFGALGQWHFLIPAVVLDHRMLGCEAIMGVGRGAATARG
ncbi:hypothetical protein D3C76_866490 [compost metagenome]